TPDDPGRRASAPHRAARGTGYAESVATMTGHGTPDLVVCPSAVERLGEGSYVNFLDAAGPAQTAACYPEPADAASAGSG
ncbi:MAG: hypothetical protein ACTMIR_00355, partial [Cellulomonadaceae bacterium]